MSLSCLKHNFFAVIMYSLLSLNVFAGQISIINKLDSPQLGQNIILQADKENAKGDDPSWVEQVVAASADRVHINQDLFSVSPLYQWMNSTIYPWAMVGYKMYLADEYGKPGPYLGYLNFTLHANPKDKAGTLSDVEFIGKGADPDYEFKTSPSIDYIPGSDMTYHIKGDLFASANLLPPIISNDGWQSGMGNSEDSFVAGKSFWVQDYGLDEPGRWNVIDNAIAQSTKKINGNSGSRAYPVIKESSGEYRPGVGVAYTGVWQIDIKIGSNGAGHFSETFYLSERRNLAPGPGNYIDGAPNKSSGIYGREIDIMETKWAPSGPSTNLPSGGGTSWNLNGKSQFGLGKMGNWSDVGGAPTAKFITFGAYITGNKLSSTSQLWLYAYKPAASANTAPTLWYSAGPIPLSSDYKQTGPFVPYIGTWGVGSEVFNTKYNNFIYLPASAVGSAVPSMNDNGGAFWRAVQNVAKSR